MSQGELGAESGLESLTSVVCGMGVSWWRGPKPAVWLRALCQAQFLHLLNNLLGQDGRSRPAGCPTGGGAGPSREK